MGPPVDHGAQQQLHTWVPRDLMSFKKVHFQQLVTLLGRIQYVYRHSSNDIQPHISRYAPSLKGNPTTTTLSLFCSPRHHTEETFQNLLYRLGETIHVARYYPLILDEPTIPVSWKFLTFFLLFSKIPEIWENLCTHFFRQKLDNPQILYCIFSCHNFATKADDDQDPCHHSDVVSADSGR